MVSSLLVLGFLGLSILFYPLQHLGEVFWIIQIRKEQKIILEELGLKCCHGNRLIQILDLQDGSIEVVDVFPKRLIFLPLNAYEKI